MADRPPMIIDSFAGGGGASTGIEMALGRSPDVAINHSAAALALHGANHPETLHLDSNIWDVKPREVTRGRPVGLLWASPDCKHFSKAKGGAPRDRNIRDLAWVIVDWAEQVAPDVILMENVEEFVTWGPVDEKGHPVEWLRGQTFAEWKRRLKRAGYRIDHRELRACDYGAPTIRKRFFLIARRDGRPIVWPKPTHGDPKSREVQRGKLLPWRTAAECVDWTVPCPSIFDSAPQIMAHHGLRAVRPLKPNTLARIARGLHRYVLEAERPFLVNLTHGARVEDLAHPINTITAAHRGEKALVAPALATYYGHGEGRGVRGADLTEPLRTVGEAPGQQPRALDLGRPLGTVVAGGVNPGRPAEAPLSTICQTGSHQTIAAAFFVKYYGTGDGARIGDPAHTVTTKDRFAHVQAAVEAPPFGPEHKAKARAVAQLLRDHGLWDAREFVTLSIGTAEFVIVDVGMRMLTPRELFRAQGFPDDYVIEGVWEGLDGDDPQFRPFPKDVQVSCCGNSVCPPLAAALVRANCGHLMAQEAAAATTT